MKKKIFVAAGCIGLIGSCCWYGSASAQKQNAVTSAGMEHEQAMLKQYCMNCHNQKAKLGGLVLDSSYMEDVGAHAATLEKVVRKVHAGVMPPAGAPRPDKASFDEFAAWLESQLDAAAAQHPNPGRTEALHRLNRAEYENCVRDLLGLKIDASNLLPADDGSYGFDNIAGVLKVSQTLMERYMSVAGTVSRLAVGDPPRTPEAVEVRLPPGLRQYDHIEGLPFGTRGGAVVHHLVPASGEYEIRMTLQRASGGTISGLFEPHDIEVSVDGKEVKVFTVKPAPPRPAAGGGSDSGRRDSS